MWQTVEEHREGGTMPNALFASMGLASRSAAAILSRPPRESSSGTSLISAGQMGHTRGGNFWRFVRRTQNEACENSSRFGLVRCWHCLRRCQQRGTGLRPLQRGAGRAKPCGTKLRRLGRKGALLSKVFLALSPLLVPDISASLLAPLSHAPLLALLQLLVSVPLLSSLLVGSLL